MDHTVLGTGVIARECCFWGDEFGEFEEGVFGSDAYMLTERTKEADFFDVSESDEPVPEGVRHVGGGVNSFLDSRGSRRSADSFVPIGKTTR